jgi:ABC-type bacteriocin/lantibiotic exporter with double-glycine peptidase domain
MNSFSSLKFQGEQNYISQQQPPTAILTILNFLRLVVEDTNLISDFHQVWVVREFELGDDLMTYRINQEKDTHNILYLVSQGQVRLFGFDTVYRQMSVDRCVAFHLLMGNVINPVLALIGLSHEFQEVLISIERHTFIQSLPLQYNTSVGKGGMTLLGRQQQRIAMTRVLLRNPRIMILDEATSSLDSESEGRFLQNIARSSLVSVAALLETHTTLIIAHRLSTVCHADSFVVLDQGFLVKDGLHQK